MEKQYQWKIKSFARKVNPDDAIQEIERIENVYGKITAETILKAASNEKSPLHELFQWDDTLAAQKYRLSQARTLINNIEVIYISDGEERSIPAYEIVRTEETQQYKHIETLTVDEIQQVRENTIQALNSLKAKLSIYKQFNRVIKQLDLALEELS